MYECIFYTFIIHLKLYTVIYIYSMYVRVSYFGSDYKGVFEESGLTHLVPSGPVMYLRPPALLSVDGEVTFPLDVVRFGRPFFPAERKCGNWMRCGNGIRCGNDIMWNDYLNPIRNNSGWDSFNTDCTLGSANNYGGKSSEGETYQVCEITISLVL